VVLAAQVDLVNHFTFNRRADYGLTGLISGSSFFLFGLHELVKEAYFFGKVVRTDLL